MDNLFRLIKTTRPSRTLVELTESLYRITCLEDHQQVILKQASDLIPLFLQNIKDCVAFLDDKQISGNELNMSPEDVSSWLTSMFGVLVNINIHNGMLCRMGMQFYSFFFHPNKIAAVIMPLK